jgi:hypothetical protein
MGHCTKSFIKHSKIPGSTPYVVPLLVKTANVDGQRDGTTLVALGKREIDFGGLSVK